MRVRARVRPAPAPLRVWGTALAIGAAAAVAAYLLMPAGAARAELTGDPELTAAVAEAIEGREAQVQGLSVTVVDGDETRAVVGGTADGTAPITADTPFETGSVFKVMTAMTLADMVETGDTSLDRTLGEVFPDVAFASPETASITLEELATHHSGLPRMPLETGGGLVEAFTLKDPYRGLPPLEESLASAVPQTRGEWAYSNFGFAVLGEALAREADTPYPDLVRQRVLAPIGMDGTFILGAGTDAIPAGAALPHSEAGARAQPWRAVPWAPAGIGTWTTTADMERFVRAVISGDAPGAAALEPVHDGPVPETRLGLAWMTTDFGDGVRLVQHSGGTFGSTAFVAVQDDRAVIALSNSMQVDTAYVGPHVMGAPAVDSVAEAPLAVAPGTALAMTLPLVLVPALLPVALMARRRTLIGQRPLDRLRVVSMPIGAAAVLLAALRTGSWVSTPPVVWALAVGAVAASAAVGAWYWPRIAGNAARFRWLHAALFAVSVAASVALGGVMVEALLAAGR
ncbi:serine hydrolase domain-containing protein [Nocardiopsis trehalosi]|uniref:serine hydrolase domain-containing protein n=1 Tax=Nocardiopsis trehalosi TaxID=109329 RepID=UPI00147266EB|nr:serine hydrolase domain-containing protein [Nocardiopsis trehalosi]